VSITIDWLGCATFRLAIDGLVVYLDTYIDRPPGAPDVGVTLDQINGADYALIGHSHWDHIAGADVVARNTGATVICSNESAHVLRRRGVPEKQLWTAQGGERYQLNETVSVRILPSLHSCIWSRAAAPGTVVTGDLGIPENERAARLAENRAKRHADSSEGTTELQALIDGGAHSDNIGGALDYLIETPHGNILFQDSMGYFTGLYAHAPVDVALLAAAGRGHIDGEPIQGSVENFIAGECELLRPSRVLLSHHDNFTGAADVPDLTDMTPVHDELARRHPNIDVLSIDLGGSLTLFD